MPEGQEGAAILVLERPAQRVDYTPLKTTTQNDPPLEVRSDPKLAFDQFKDQVREVAKRVNGRSWDTLSREDKEAVQSVKRSPQLIFEQYYRSALETGNTAEIIQFYNPQLSVEEVSKLQDVLNQYIVAKKEIPGRHVPGYQEYSDKYQPIVNRLRETLEAYKLQDLTDIFAATRFSDRIKALVRAELFELGMPFNFSGLGHKINVLAYLKSKEATDLYKRFFTDGISNKLQKEIYEESMDMCLTRSVGGFFDDTHWEEKKIAEDPAVAIEFLAQYPTPEVVRRLIVINSLDMETVLDNRGRKSTFYPGHAQRALLKMKEGTNWHEVVNDTLGKYPELEPVRSELLELQVSDVGGRMQQGGVLHNLRYAVEKRILVPVQLGLVSLPSDDPKLSEYIRSHRVQIAVRNTFKEIVQSRKLQDLTGNEIYELPLSIVSDREKVIDEVLNRPDLTPEQRDIQLDRYRRMFLFGKALQGTDLINDRYKPSDNVQKLVVQLLDSDMTDEQLSSATHLIANTQLPVAVFLRGDRVMYEELQRISKVNNILADEGFFRFVKGRDTPERLLNLGLSLIDSSLTEDQIVSTAQQIMDFSKNVAFVDRVYRSDVDLEADTATLQEYFLMLKQQGDNREAFDNFFSALAVYRPEVIKTLTLQNYKAIFGNDGVRRYAEDDPTRFITQSAKQDWRELFGDEVMDEFFQALPINSDERRNAFLHNKYDRTTDFMHYLVDRMKIKLSKDTVQMAGEYIQFFGFSKCDMVVECFEILTQLENGSITELPQRMKNLGLTNKTEFLKSINLLKNKMYGEEPLIDLSSFNPLELEILNVMTGKASHRFDTNRPKFTQIVSDFQKDSERGHIEGIPEGYSPITLTSSNVELHLDTSPYSHTVRELASEVRSGIDFKNESTGILQQAHALLRGKVTTLKKLIESTDPHKRSYLEAEVRRFEDYAHGLGELSATEVTSDLLFQRLISIKLGKTDRAEFGKLIRAAIFARLYEAEPGFRDWMMNFSDLRDDDAPIEPETILKLKDFIKDPIQEHVLKFNSEGDLMKYWSPETRAEMRVSRDNLRDIFEPYYGKLSEGAGAIRETQTSSDSGIQAIPDRGFIGEMSGYLADVCYTAEYPFTQGARCYSI